MFERNSLLMAMLSGVSIWACAENVDFNGEDLERIETRDSGELSTDADVERSDVTDEAPLCSWPTGQLPEPIESLPTPKSPHRGVDSYEMAAYEKLRDSLLEDPGILFTATYNHDIQSYVVVSGSGEGQTSLEFQRIEGSDKRSLLQVTKGNIETIFPSQDPDVFATYEDLLEAFENPLSSRITDSDYPLDDPRVGFLPPDRQSYPLVMERISALFDARDAPDLIVGFQPWAQNSVGVHGSMSVLQSRATLIFSGPGVRKGATIEKSAKLVDIAPTIMAMLDAKTTGGIGPDGVYGDGLYLQWQDGRVLTEIFDTEVCDRPTQALLILFDGLLPTELLHQIDSSNPDVDLPNFRHLRMDGTAFQTGAVTNFPSVSAPGHMTTGTGVWSGHHGTIANSVFRRETREQISVFALLDNIQATLANPQQLYAIYEASAAEEIETLSQAIHRNFGEYDAESDSGAFTAVINELAIGGADYTTVDFLIAGGAGSTAGASVTTYGMADSLAINQVETIFSSSEFPVPKLLEMSLFTTDAAGESTGPHSDLVRLVLVDMDKALGQILDAYSERGALEDTLIVLVSDHGMELQDPSRRHELYASIASSGVKIHHAGSGLLYLPTLRLEMVQDPDPEQVQIRVVDHWNNNGVKGVEISCSACTPSQQFSDDSGNAVFRPVPGTSSLTFESTHEDYNLQTAITPWPIP